MTDYKKIADMMMDMPVENKVLDKKEFESIMEKRNLKFVQNIDELKGTKREVWGNSHFQIIVLHKNENFQIL